MFNYLGAIIDAAAAIFIAAIIYANTSFSNWLRTYFVLPVLLLWVHATGSVFQTIDYGSEWVQNHMHNLGVPAWGMFIAMVFGSKLTDRSLARATVSEQHVGAKFIMTCAVWGWMGVATIGIAAEVVDITLLRDEKMADGYSGKLDWLDILSYVAGSGLVYLNHRKLRPIVLGNIGRARRRR